MIVGASSRVVRMSHPDPNGPADTRPITAGEVWENPVSGEHAILVELPYANLDGHCVAELTALAGTRVGGEHRHPAAVERFTVLEGELTVKRNGQEHRLGTGETMTIEAGIWHDWWNESDRDARLRAEITPGERIIHMIETVWGVARLGHSNSKGAPHPLQLALTAREFRDVVVFRSPPFAVQRALFGALAPIARRRGYRATYPQLSRAVATPLAGVRERAQS